MKTKTEKIIDCVAIADKIVKQIKINIDNLMVNDKPVLAVVLVGNNQASQLYVKHKELMCQRVGIHSRKYILPISITQLELLTLIHQLNSDKDIHGILVQLPLPPHLDNSVIIDAILPNKDVDGFHKQNIGGLAIGQTQLRPCTPYGIMQILAGINIDLVGKHAVIIGSSNIVGRPMALELINAKATVTICNSKTKDLQAVTNSADILVVAIGKAKMITQEYIKPNSIVIDVGINRDTNGKLCGDVDLLNVLPKVSYITPVPLGVGKLTVAMLMQNTLLCYQLNKQNK
jgi:methylenetetrahydrofolate dehydrogenase (NADP+)/methenyltetrahydrofolate cyclohydrolase